jgi:hypothetical protein
MKNRLIGITTGGWNSLRRHGVIWFQILLILVWALWIGREYLDFDARAWPTGAEVVMSTQSHYMWEAFQRCGLCFLWNGATNGGVPAFVDVHGAPYHPIVAIPTLLFGVLNGDKAALILSLMLAGLAQLWLGKLLKLNGWIATWCALMAVAGGHLAGKMENGVVPLVISTACASLLIPALLQFFIRGSRGNTVLLGLVMASAILAGQGYVQIGFALSIVPVYFILALMAPRDAPFQWKRFAFAIGLALLLTAFFLLPLIRFLPSWMKYGDPLFQSAQPLSFLPLNLVINDWQFLDSPLLQKLPTHVYFYTNYIGWVPVILAILTLILLPKTRRKLMYFCMASIIMVYLVASAITLKVIAVLNPTTLGFIENPPLIAGLAIPFVLMLAGLGLQYLLDREWPAFTLGINRPDTKPVVLSARYPVYGLAILIVLAALQAAAVFTEDFYRTEEFGLGTQRKVLDALQTPELEWIQPPWAEYFWLPLTEPRGMKIAVFVRPWFWKDQKEIRPQLLALREDKPEFVKTGQVGDFQIYTQPDVHYASLVTEAGDTIPCSATGMWGNLDVACQSESAGTLTLQEYYRDGWYGQVDGQPDSIIKGMFLSVDVPAGDHTIQFRYRPWDVWVGLFISCAGMVLAIGYWIRGRRENTPSVEL